MAAGGEAGLLQLNARGHHEMGGEGLAFLVLHLRRMAGIAARSRLGMLGIIEGLSLGMLGLPEQTAGQRVLEVQEAYLVLVVVIETEYVLEGEVVRPLI